MTAAAPGGRRHYDVVVLGEVLVEVATEAAFDDGVEARLGVSGDALNVAAAAAAAGAEVGLISVLSEDELGQAVRRRIEELGVSTDLLCQRPGQQGAYFVHSDPEGNREFSYARSHSVGSTLSPEDLDLEVLRNAGAVIASGITAAISDTAAQAVDVAAAAARRFVYDPNHRPRLSSLEDARRRLRELAPLSWLVTPSSPGETSDLLDAESPDDAARALTSMGASNVAVTCGADGIHLLHDGETRWISSVPAPHVIDQTGAGDAFLGSTTARAVLGDALPDAVRWGAAVASLVVGGRGGTGFVPTAAQTREHLRTAPITEEGAP
ncbi:sugar kinase [Nesterenkonia sp. HG001]|uniref:sugar kinase n=1 Tax=Nesterenkonia sp. HG001 TaxID=2983207 RepID=UPI002AC63A34|nr:sugar kinase [Nesterenkonia sp. HG001]MDZ5076608.1 sugar kinase [Nesterenkonia sp. HG001]